MGHLMSSTTNVYKRFGIEDHVWFIHEFGIDLDKNEIFLAGENQWDEEGMEPGVEHIMATRFIKNLNILSTRIPSEEGILIHLKTCGGIWEEGMAIYDSISLCANYITMLNYTHARSMSSLIFLAGDYKVMMPNSCFMFHDGTYSDSGTVKQVSSGLKFYENAGQAMLDIYVDTLIKAQNGKFFEDSPKTVRTYLRKLMDKKEDVFLTADEAVEWGFADEIFDGDWTRLSNKRS